jgi:hypothetical protein
MNSLNQKSYYLSDLSPDEAFQLGDFSSVGWYNAYLSHEALQKLRNEYKLETIFSIIENCMIASAKDIIWLEFLFATLEEIQKQHEP